MPFPAAAPHAQKARQIRIRRGNRTESWGFRIGRFCSTHPDENKITKGHMSGTSQKYVSLPCTSRNHSGEHGLRLPPKLHATRIFVKLREWFSQHDPRKMQKTSGRFVRWFVLPRVPKPAPSVLRLIGWTEPNPCRRERPQWQQVNQRLKSVYG